MGGTSEEATWDFIKATQKGDKILRGPQMKTFLPYVLNGGNACNLKCLF